MVAVVLFCKVTKTAQKALGKARKSGAEGESLKLLKESGAIFSLHLITLAVRHHLTLTLATLGYAALLAKNSRST